MRPTIAIQCQGGMSVPLWIETVGWGCTCRLEGTGGLGPKGACDQTIASGTILRSSSQEIEPGVCRAVPWFLVWMKLGGRNGCTPGFYFLFVRPHPCPWGHQ